MKRLLLVLLSCPLAAQAPAKPAPAAPGDSAPKLWVNYDFVPGNKVLFFTDYADDQVGNFPKRLTFKLGNMEVAELGGKRYLRATSKSIFIIPLAAPLPAKFTMEIDFINRPTLDGPAFQIQGIPVWSRDGKTSTISWGNGGVSLLGGGGGETLFAYDGVMSNKYRGKAGQLRVRGDGGYIKVYLDEKRYVNVPNANFGRTTSIIVDLDARSDDVPLYVGAIRIAESGMSIYDDILAKGQVTTQGILFASGSDKIKPESAPTLKEIGAMLVAHPELKLTVEGHTDDVGAAAENLKLSEARAAAVVAALIKDHGIEAARLSAKGLGSTKPAVPNTTAEGRQNNRRVVLVKS